MNKRIIFALPVLLAFTACKPQPSPEPAATAPATEATPATPPAGGVGQPMALPEAPTALDTATLAGRFGDGDTVLELHADGTYVQTLNAAGSAMQADGHWGADGDNAILLDPNSKEAADTRFEVVSNDLLRGGDGREFKRIAE